ncbi:MAG: hypothetical protein AB1478_02760 [Nitrospirota bacterium]
MDSIEVKMVLKVNNEEIKLSLQNLSRDWTESEIISARKKMSLEIETDRCLSTTDIRSIYNCVQSPSSVLCWWSYEWKNLHETKIEVEKLINQGKMSYRNQWKALVIYPDFVEKLLKELDGKSWKVEIKSDKKNRGVSVNVSVYDYDIHHELAVVQIRQCEFGGQYNSVRKNYYLIGRNENGNAFAHPISSVLTGKKYKSYINKALCEIWRCSEDELPYVVRNGDVAFIPCKKPEAATLLPEKVLKIENHIIKASNVYRGKTVEAPASIKHEKGQHPTIVVRKGFYRVQKGNRAPEWDFSAATRD